jgi:hypothetical protein
VSRLLVVRDAEDAMNFKLWGLPLLAGALVLGGCGRAILKQDLDDRPPLASDNFPGPDPIEQRKPTERAAVLITDERGFKVLSKRTPTVMSLVNDTQAQNRSYRILISMDGTPSHERQLKAKRDGWYIRGSRVFADSIGGLVVDPQTGAMYTISMQDAGSVFAEAVAQSSGNLSSGTYLVLLSDVPDELKSKLTRVL